MGGKKDKGARTPYEAPNSLSSAQVLRVIDAVAEGELAGFGNGDDAPLKSVFFNDTPVQNADGSFNFKGVSAFFVRGTPDQPYIPGFAATERTVAVGAAVKRNTPVVRAVTNAQTDRLRVTVGVERNLAVQDNGDTVASVTELVVELAGANGVAAMQTVRFGEKSSGVYYQDVEFDALPPVPFNLRVRRHTPDSASDRVINNTFFASYVEITDIKLSYPHTALAALKIDSDQFGNQIPRRNYLLRGKLLQVPSNYNPETRQYAGLWDGSFKTAWTNNPVWVFYDLLTNPRYSTLARRLTAADVDKWALYEIAKYCDAPVPDGFGGQEPRFTCNAYITDARQAADVLSDLAAAFCALPVWDGQRLSLRADTAAEPVAQYGNANVVDGIFAYAGAALKAVHTAVHVRYADKHDGWRMKTEYIADDAAIARYGLNIKAVTAFGCDSRGQAVRFGEWLLQTELRQQDTVTFSVGREGLRHLPHDIIRIADNDYAGADIGGRVKAVSGSLLTLDRAVTAAAGQILHYAAADGSFKSVRIAAQTAPDVLQTETAAGVAANAVWALAGQVKPRLYRALSVRENSEDGTYTVTALRHAPAKYAAVDGSAAFERSTLHGQTPAVSGGEVRGDNGALALTWEGGGADGDVLAYDVKIYRNGSLYRHIPDTPAAEIRLENLPDGDYRADIRARNARGVWSATLQKAWRISYAIEGLRTSGKTLAVDLAWNLPETVANSVQTELRYGTSADFQAALPLAKLPYPQNRYTLTGVAVTDTYYFWARLADADGRAGEWTAAVIGRADTDPAPIVRQIQGAIEKSTLSQALINQLKADDTAAENRAKAAASSDAARKVAAEAQARSAEIRREAEARAAALRNEADKQAAALRAESGKLTTAITAAAQTARSELAAQVAQLAAKDGELQQAHTALDGKAAGLSRTAQQLGNRITAAETVNREQASAIQTVTAAQGRTAAALEAEKTARANGDAAEARARETLAATVGQHTAALSAERQARTDGDAANTRELQAARARIGAAESSIGELRQTVSSQNSATASRLDSLTAKLGADTNLIDAATTQAGHYIGENNGNVLNWNNHVLTDFIPVAAGQTYAFTSAVAANNLRYAWYNAQRAFVSGRLVTGDSTHQTLTAPSGAAFVRISGGTNRNTAAFALRLDPSAAALEAERTARVAADEAQTRELNTAKSQIGQHTAALAEVREAKADKNQVAALARSGLQSEWQNDIAAAKAQAQQAAAQDAQNKANAARQAAERAAASDAQAKAAAAQAAAQSAASAEIRAAKEAAAQDAQRKADAAKSAAEAAARQQSEAADRAVLQQAARDAQSKADNARQAAQTAAAADAQSKANAAKAQAVADAAAKDAVLKREAAADAQAKADAVRAVAEAARRAAQTVAADLVREQQTRAAADEANAREITAAKARLGTAESGIGELRQTTARQNQALAETQNSLTAKMDGIAAEWNARDNLLAADIWESGNIGSNGADLSGFVHFWRIRSDAALQVSGGAHYVLQMHGGEYSLQWSWYAADGQFLRGDWASNTATDRRTAPDNAATLRLSIRNRSHSVYDMAAARPRLYRDLAADTAAVSAVLTAFKQAQANTDAAQTAELQAARSQIGQHTAALEQMRSGKADKTEVSTLARTSLQSEWRSYADTAKNQAQQAAAQDAQAKANAAQRAAEQAAERLALAKADAAKQAAIAAASGDAQRKADAAKAAALADAAAKDAVLKREAAADAQRKADAAKNAAIGEAQRLNTAATARINTLESTLSNHREAAARETRELSARLDNLQAGGRNYVRNSDFADNLHHWDNWGAVSSRSVISAHGRQWLRLTAQGAGRYRGVQQIIAGFVPNTPYTVSFDAYAASGGVVAGLHQIGTNFSPQIWRNFALTDTPQRIRFSFISANDAAKNAFRIMLGGSDAGNFDICIGNIKFEQGNLATDWTPAPEDGASALQAAITAEREARTAADTAQTAEITAAKAQIGSNKAAIDGFRSSKADKTEVTALARNGLQSEWRNYADTAKIQAVQTAANDAQTKATAAQRAAEQAAERLATAKANAAQAAASGDATGKANAAKAAAIADAAAKDEAVKRAAAADAQNKANNAKQAAIAEANRLNTATAARVNTLEQTVSSQNSATASRFATVEASVQTAKNEAVNAYKIQDTRNDNRPPSWYRANYPNRTVEEFKKAAAIGLTGGGGTFAYLRTNVRWGDATGGPVHQSAEGDNGKRFSRYSTGDNWTAWTETETVAGAQAKIDSERTARVHADNAQTREINTAKSQIGTAQSQLQTLQNTVAANHRAQTEQVNTLSAKLDNLQVGGRNYLLASDRSTSGNLSFGLSADLTADTVRGKTLTVSCDIVCTGIRAGHNNRIGAEVRIEYADGTSAYVGAWRNNAHTAGDFKGRISGSLKLADKAVRRIHPPGIYNQTGGGTATVSRPKLELGSVATDWTPAPEDGVTAAQIQAVQNALAEKDRAQTERTNTLTAKVGTAEANVRTAQTAVTALNGKVQALHTVKVQAVGRRKAVAGLALGADGATGDSQFVVMADKFALVRPGSTAIQTPFVVTTAGGQTKLALAGDMIADGLIQGKHIAAGQTIRTPTLIAASLQIGSFTMQPSGAFSSRSTAPNQAGLSIDNNRIVIRDSLGRIRTILGYLR